MSLARGEYIMIMDDDDYSFPTRMEKQVEYLNSHPEITGVATQIDGHDAIPLDRDEIAWELLYINVLNNASMMYRREFAAQHRIKYDETLHSSEDWNYWIDMLFLGAKFAVISDKLYRTNRKNKKYYKTKFEESDIQIRKNIGKHFFAHDENLFYKLALCQRVQLITQHDILSPEAERQAIKAFCPQ